MFIPEIKELIKVKKIFGFWPKIRFIFSIRNQIIIFSLVSNAVASLSFVPIFTDHMGFFGIFIILSFFIAFIQQVQIITLWSFFLKKSKKFSLKQLTKSQV
jgi:hypothetical protein